MRISFSVEGEKQLSRRLRGISEDFKDWKDEFADAGNYLVDVFSGPVFRTEGREIGEPWQERKKYYPWAILQKTGTMRRSFTYNVRFQSVEVYNTVEYFIYHQSNKPRTKLPRRVMIKLDNERKEGIVKIFHNAINRILRNGI